MSAAARPGEVPPAGAVERVVATAAALRALREVEAQHGPVLLYESGGCCDGSVPICFGRGELLLGEGDVLLGYAGDCPVYVDRRQLEVWWTSQLIVDVGEGDPEGFSLPAGPGRHFVARARICAPDRLAPPVHGRPHPAPPQNEGS